MKLSDMKRVTKLLERRGALVEGLGEVRKGVQWECDFAVQISCKAGGLKLWAKDGDRLLAFILNAAEKDLADTEAELKSLGIEIDEPTPTPTEEAAAKAA